MKFPLNKNLMSIVGTLIMSLLANFSEAKELVFANFVPGLVDGEDRGAMDSTYEKDGVTYITPFTGSFACWGYVSLYFGDQAVGEYIDRAVDFRLSSDTRVTAIGLLLTGDYSESPKLFENDVYLVLCADDGGKPGVHLARFKGTPYPGKGIASADGYWKEVPVEGEGWSSTRSEFVYQSRFNETVLYLDTPYPIEANKRYWIVAKQTSFTGFRAYSMRTLGQTSHFLERRTDRMYMINGNWTPTWSDWDSQSHRNWGGQDDYMYDLTEEGVSMALRVYAAAAPQVWVTESVTVKQNEDVLIDVVVDDDAETVSTSSLPSGLVFNEIDGTITGRVTKVGNYTITVTASNGEGTTRATCALTVQERPPPTPTSLSITSQPVGGTVSFGKTLKLSVSVSGSNPVYQWSKDGKTINGATSNTLTVASAGNYTVTVSNTVNKVTSSTATVSIAPGVPSMKLTVTRKVGAIATGDPDFQVSIAGEQGVLTYYTKDLPKGLKLNKTTGAVTGTFTKTGLYKVTYWTQIGKTKGDAVTQTITIEKPLAPVALPGAVLAQKLGAAGVNWTIRNTSPEAATLTYYAKGLPKGLKLNKVTGEITGTITAKSGLYKVSFWSQVGSNKSDSIEQTITIEKPLAPVALPGAILTQKLGAAGVNWTIRNTNPEASTLTYYAKNLPKGLKLNKATGEITGTITAKSGSYKVTFWSQVGSNKSDSIEQTIAIEKPLPPAALSGAVLTQKLGAAAVSWTIRNTSPEASTLAYYARGLPKGLKLNKATGEIIGTITAKSGPYKVTFWSQVGSNKSGSIEQTITIEKPLPPVALPGAILTQKLGAAAVSWTIRNTSPEASTLTYYAKGLPKGLKLNKVTGEITGTITAKSGLYKVSFWSQVGSNKSDSIEQTITINQ